ncbi:hypothetical protein LCGC14_1523980, partial [marine sediment metagenome]
MFTPVAGHAFFVGIEVDLSSQPVHVLFAKRVLAQRDPHP